MDYSLTRKKFEAAMSLYGQAQTDLKSGASGRAITKLALARAYNPWHDDIKDLYALSVRHFTGVTKRMGATADCSTLEERFSFLNEVAPDSLSDLQTETTRCGFTPRKKIFQTSSAVIPEIKVPESSVGELGASNENLLNELNLIVGRNRHVPKHELMSLALDYLSKVRIDIKSIQISPLSKSTDQFQIIASAEFRNEGGFSGKEYCQQTQKLLEMADGDDQITCRYWNGFSGNGELSLILPRKSGHVFVDYAA